MHDDARFSVGFLCLRCTTKTVIKISWWEATTNLSFSLNFWMNSFKIVEISLPSHRKCTKHIRTEGRIISSWDQTLYTDISFWFRSSNDAYRKYTGAWNVSFWTVCMPAYKVAWVAGPRNHWPDKGPSNGAAIFYNAGFLAKLRSCWFVTSS